MTIIIAVMLTTIFIRFLPFLIMRGEVPNVIKNLGASLQYATMAMLVVYCLKIPLTTNIKMYNLNIGYSELIAILIILVSYKIKHNTLLSILLGTIIYVILVNI